MINFINTWAQRIIIAVIICTIIEMILPDGKNKKYVKTIAGIYVMFTIISPIISKLNGTNININKSNLDLNFNNNLSIETSVNLNTNQYVEELYIENLKKDIKAKIQAINYEVEGIEVNIETKNEEKYGSILKLDIKLAKQEEKTQNKIEIKNIVIGDEKPKIEENITNEEKNKIKEYIAETYYIDKDIININ